MNGIRPPQKYSELLAARNYLNEMIKENKDKEIQIILNDIKADLDQYFINLISTFEHQIDINYPII
jgi:hypothetical protein